MESGDFEEARSDFNKMMSIDKSSERNARAALLKLKQKEQEVKKKDRKQFKGLFDRKPGEIAEAGNVDKSDQTAEKDNQENTDISKEDDIVEDAVEAAPSPPLPGLLAHLWSSRKNLFISSGLQMLVMLAIVYLIKRLL